MRFKIDWASLIVGTKSTVFAFLCIRGQFLSTSPPGEGAYIWRGDLTEGFLHPEFGGLIFGGAYFRNFTVVCSRLPHYVRVWNRLPDLEPPFPVTQFTPFLSRPPIPHILWASPELRETLRFTYF